MDLIGSSRSPILLLEDGGRKDLAQTINQGKVITVEDALIIAIKVVNGLKDIHEQKIVHKDICPRNILVNDGLSKVKIIDFSISVRAVDLQKETVVSHNFMGSLPYMSPEQTGRMNRRVDYRSDFYSLGITLYEILVGKKPFRCDDMLAYMHAHIAIKPIDPSRLNDKIPEFLASIIMKLLAKEPTDRYQNIYVLKKDLEYCLHYVQNQQPIPAKRLAENDISDRFELADKIYGRENDLKRIEERISEGDSKPKIITISGPSGIGKSSLINELKKTMTVKQGFFSSGKSEQISASETFKPFREIFTQLLEQISEQSDRKISEFKSNLEYALGHNVSIVAQLTPRFSKLLGCSTQAESLEISEEQNRIIPTLIDFLSLFANQNGSLVVFLDDMQWIDTSSLFLLEEIFKGKKLNNVAFIFSYRSKEIDSGHPFSIFFHEVQKNYLVHNIVLKPFDKRTISSLIGDSIKLDQNHRNKLAAAVFEKTGGHPLQCREFLKRIHQQKFIFFNDELVYWEVDFEKISNLPVSQNLAKIMIDRINGLPKDCLDLLYYASLLGSRFSSHILCKLKQITLIKMVKSIKFAVKEGLILPLNSNYRLFQFADESSLVSIEHFDFQFQHDSIQKAVVEAIDPAEKPKMHLCIAKTLEGASNSNQAHNIAFHYNKAKNLIANENEKVKLVKLNIAAARSLKIARNYRDALAYLEESVQVLSKEKMIKHGIYIPHGFELIDLYIYCGYFEKGEVKALEIMGYLKDDFEKARLQDRMSQGYLSQGDMIKAISHATSALKLLGFPLTDKASKFAVAAEFIKFIYFVKKNPLHLIENKPIQHDKRTDLALKILCNTANYSYTVGDENLYTLAMLKGCYISISSGPYVNSSFLLYGLSTVLFNVLKLYKLGAAFYRLGKTVASKNPDPVSKAKARMVELVVCAIWHEDFLKLYEPFKLAIRNNYQSSNTIEMTGLAINIATYNLVVDVQSQLDTMNQYEDLILQAKIDNYVLSVNLVKSYLKNFRGLTAYPTSLSFDEIKDHNLKRQAIDNRFLNQLAGYYIFKEEICFWHEKYHFAYLYSKKASSLVLSIVGTVYEMQHRLFKILILIEKFRQASKVKKIYYYLNAIKEYQIIKSWARHNPKNFAFIQALLEAEFSTINMRFSVAKSEGLYEKAIDYGKLINYKFEVLANLQAMKFYLRCHLKKMSFLYYKQALHLLVLWKAESISKSLKVRYEEIFSGEEKKLKSSINQEKSTYISLHEETTHQNTMMHSKSLDFKSLVKTFQILSSEVRLEILTTKSLNFLMENAGASSGALIYLDEGGSNLVCQEMLGFEESYKNMPLDDSSFLPLPVIEAAREGIINLEDAAKSSQFTDDPYIKRKKSRSILAVPLKHQGKVLGLIYLENTHFRSLFTGERVEFVEVLSSQVAISLFNARLYHQLEKKVLDKTQDIKQIMENIKQGIFSVLPTGFRIHEYYSQHLQIILGQKDLAGKNIFQVLFTNCDLGTDQTSLVENALDVIFENKYFLYGLNSQHLPKEVVYRLPDQKKILELDWSPIVDEDQNIERMLVSVRDITDIKLLKMKAEKQEKELIKIKEIIVTGVGQFKEFVEQSFEFITNIENLRAVKNKEIRFGDICAQLHTFKAVSRKYKVHSISDLIHRTEQILIDHDVESIGLEELSKFITYVNNELDEYQDILKNKFKVEPVQPSLGKHGLLWSYIKKAMNQKPTPLHQSDLLSIATEYFQSSADFLEALQNESRIIAEKLDKPEPQFTVDSDLIFFQKNVTRNLEGVFLHLISNSMVHGFEDSSIRQRNGKSSGGNISIAVKQAAQGLRITYYDDGCGLDLKTIYARSPLKTISYLDIAHLVFSSGLSTREQTDQFAGRGFGLHAAKTQIEKMGGEMKISFFNEPSSFDEKVPFKFELYLPDDSFIAGYLDRAA